jgi:DNA-binding transcriptional LysR family regulator
VQCSRILEEMEAARSTAKPEAPVRGNMRITAPVVFGSTRLGPLVVDFMRLHPELSLNIELSDRSVDLIEEGFDLAIRTGPANGPGLTAWPLMSLDYVLCAAPAYLARHGVPRSPSELQGHHCIAGTDTPPSWQFSGPEGNTEVPIYGRLQVNNAMLRRDAARAGAGILLCADYLVDGILPADIWSGSCLSISRRAVHCTLSAPPIAPPRRRFGIWSVISRRSWVPQFDRWTESRCLIVRTCAELSA